jgi:hypothetical protein
MTRSRKELTAARREVAVAKLMVWCRECHRLARLAAEGAVDRVDAADCLYDIAVGNGLVDAHGDDFIAGMLAAAFEWAPVGSAPNEAAQ